MGCGAGRAWSWQGTPETLAVDGTCTVDGFPPGRWRRCRHGASRTPCPAALDSVRPAVRERVDALGKDVGPASRCATTMDPSR